MKRITAHRSARALRWGLALWLASSWGCATLLGIRDYDRPETRTLVEALANRPAPSAFKGIGTLRVFTDGRRQTFRLAWVAVRPGKLRIELLAPGGPAVKFATDGEWIYLLSPADGKRHVGRDHHPDFGDLLPVPVTVRDLVALMAGRVPLGAFDRAESAPADDGIHLTAGRRGRTVSEAWLSAEDSRLLRLERFGSSGELIYRCEPGHYTVVDGHRIPFSLRFTADDARTGMTLQMERFWPETAVSPDLFVLDPAPAGGGR